MLRSREARAGAFALILIAAASAWPTLHYGQQGYDRVKGMVDSEAQKWLDEHKHRGEQLIYVFYALARSRWYQSLWNGSGRKPRCR